VAVAIPSDAHVVGDPGHTPDSDNIADVLGLFAAFLAQGTGPLSLRTTPPSGNANALAAIQSMLNWGGNSVGANYLPWQFPVEAYGALGNGRVITDATMLTASNLLNSPAQASFVNSPMALGGDIGKSVLVSCAGGGTYSPLGCTATTPCTITAVNSPTQAVLSVSSTSATPGASTAIIGTDDTAAIRAAQAASLTYAQAGNGYAEIVFGNYMYVVAAPCVIGGATKGNAQIPLPVVSPTTGQKILLVYTGTTKTLDQALLHWLQTKPQTAGPVLACVQTGGTNDGTNGAATVLGGPFAGYGGDLGLFSNIMPVIDGIQIVVPYNSTVGGFDFFGCAEAVVPNASCMALGMVPAGPPYPSLGTNSNISNQYTFGLRMPCTGCNDRCDVFSFSCEGLCYGIMPSEHSAVFVTRCIYCITGIEFYSGNAVSMPHTAYVSYASVEACVNACGVFDGTVNIDITDLDSETCATLMFDTSNRGQGTIYFRQFTPPAYSASAASIVNTAVGMKMVCLDNAVFCGVVTSGAPAAPATTVAQLNGWFRDAFVFVTSTTAITVAKVTSQAGVITTITGLITAAGATMMIPVPSGHSYSVTSTGTITTQWVVL
jgi:hypothetical protein